MALPVTRHRASSVRPAFDHRNLVAGPQGLLPLSWRPLLRRMQHAQDAHGQRVFRVHNYIVCTDDHFPRALHPANPVEPWMLIDDCQ